MDTKKKKDEGWTYAYDLSGNILEKKRYAYTTAADLSALTPEQTVPYSYGDAGWKDKLTSFDGKPITHDTIGNPFTYDGWAYTWKAGRMLHSMVRGGENPVNAEFTYDHTGLRVKKTVNRVDTFYTLNGKKITHIRKGANGATGADAAQLHFFYDAQGRPMMVRTMDVDYAYLHNLQGDVVGIVDMNGVPVVEYGYDAWGKPVFTEGSMAETLGKDNPFRYRGYVWDEETGLYYLRSRYYNPSWGRFVNADAVLGQTEVLLSHNGFSYCSNNPVNRIDPSGHSWFDALRIGLNRAIVKWKITAYTYAHMHDSMTTARAVFLDKLVDKANQGYVKKGVGKYTYGKGSNQYLCDTIITSSLVYKASVTGMTRIFKNHSVVNGTMESIGGYDNLIPGMIVGQGTLNGTVNHGGVYLGYFAINEGDKPGHVVVQSVSTNAGVPGRPKGGACADIYERGLEYLDVAYGGCTEQRR